MPDKPRRRNELQFRNPRRSSQESIPETPWANDPEVEDLTHLGGVSGIIGGMPRNRTNTRQPAPLPPDPDEIVNIIAGPDPDVFDCYYRVVRRRRIHEPVVFPSEEDIDEALENDPDLLDRESLSELLYDKGETVFKHGWDSGGPGAGAGTESIQELDGRFYYLCDWAGLYGPFNTIDGALEGTDLLIVNEATSGIESGYHSDEELAAKVDCQIDPCVKHEVLLNWIPYVCVKPGVLVKLDEEKRDDEV